MPLIIAEQHQRFEDFQAKSVTETMSWLRSKGLQTSIKLVQWPGS